MAKKRNTDSGPSFEESLRELEAIIERVESGEVGLEQSIDEYEKGVDLIKRCRLILERAEQRIQRLSLDDLESRTGSSPEEPSDDEEPGEEPSP